MQVLNTVPLVRGFGNFRTAPPPSKPLPKTGGERRACSFGPRLFSLFPCLLLALSLFPVAGLAKVGEDTGLFYFAVENIDTGAVVFRSTGDDKGIDRIILAPQTNYIFWSLFSQNMHVGFSDFTTPRSGLRFKIPPIEFFKLGNTGDADGDGLHDLGEFIVGTNPDVADTDADGVTDCAEVVAGTDPLDGLLVDTGIIATAGTPGTALDVCALNDIVIVADGSAGVVVFNVTSGRNPVRIAQVDTPGFAQDVDFSGTLIAVADAGGGLGIIDVSDPPASAIVHQVLLGGPVEAVASGGGLAFAGLASGDIATVDMATGSILSRFGSIKERIEDLALGGDFLYALTDLNLYALRSVNGELSITGQAPHPGDRFLRRLRLFVGDDLIYATQKNGYNIYSITDPAQPSFLKQQVFPVTEFGWIQIVANGTGLGVAAAGPNGNDDPPHNIRIYDLGLDRTKANFITEFPTPGVAVAVVLFNGLAYVADSAAGLQVINYLAYDSQGMKPTISLDTSALAGGLAEEGKIFRITANVSDDVQVRNVTFFIDGALVANDGNFPFEHRFETPRITPQKNTFTLQAFVMDTGGNLSGTDLLTLTLVPDATPPEVVKVLPARGSFAGTINSLSVSFSEPIDPATLNPDTFQLLFAGPDNVLSTADDVPVTDGVITYRDSINTAFMEFSIGLSPGVYFIIVHQDVTDVAGNRLAADFTSNFRAFAFIDSDSDGVPDDVEPDLGLDPNNSDTDGDGIPDGLEDFDADGLSNAGEFLTGDSPTNPDTNGDGILDGLEDSDRDGLSNAQEIALGTNPAALDSDGDLFSDDAEVLTGSDPVNPDSKPALTIIGHPPVSILALNSATGNLAPGVTFARPPVSILALNSETGNLPPGVTIARPPVSILALNNQTGNLAPGVTVARPPVSVILLKGETGNLPTGVTVAKPPVSISFAPPPPP